MTTYLLTCLAIYAGIAVAILFCRALRTFIDIGPIFDARVDYRRTLKFIRPRRQPRCV